jgi:hypothetical protein
MGMFTSIRHPEDGRELQIKTGSDDCEWYDVGDTVNWSVCQFIGGNGTLLDGAYPSYSDRGPDDWVVIKDHKVHAVVPREEEVHEGTLWKQFDLQSPDPSLWSEEAWEQARKIREKVKREAEEFRQSIAHLPPEVQMGMLLVGPIKRRLNYTEIGRKMFLVEPLPETSSRPTFLKDPWEN